MKKWIACLLVLALALPLGSAWAEGYDPDHLTVASPTALSGNFFTDMWGNNTSDMDVRMLLEGYGLIRWDGESSSFVKNDSVVRDVAITANSAGDRTYLFLLANDLYYSDGTKITAWDYAFSILLSAAPEIAAIGGDNNGSDPIYGVDAYKNGTSSVLTGVSSASDSAMSRSASGTDSPCSHLETVCRTT